MTNSLQLPTQLKHLIDNFSYDADNLGFGKTLAPIMIEMHYEQASWNEMQFKEYAKLQIDPAAKVLHYAQEIFEGMKAYKNEAGEVFLFRPDMNAKRFNLSAQRMAMPTIDENVYIESCKAISNALAAHVPVGFGKSLYLRPFMIGTEPTLGVRASSTYSYYVIACLVESYFSRPSVSVKVERENCRAAPGGIGYAKTGGNYGASLQAYATTQQEGCDQTLWLDAIEKRYIEELSGMNFFAVINDQLVTPQLSDTILAGITRDSILKLAQEVGLTPVEKRLSIDELLDDIKNKQCLEAFACGTASVITPIDSIKFGSQVYQLEHSQGPIAAKLKQRLLELQRGQGKDPFGWSLKIN